MHCLSQEKIGTDYCFSIHLDETKFKAAPNDKVPDPDYVEHFTWGMPPAGVTEKDYIAMIKRELPLLVADRLSKMNPKGVPLSMFN